MAIKWELIFIFKKPPSSQAAKIPWWWCLFINCWNLLLQFNAHLESPSPYWGSFGLKSFFSVSKKLKPIGEHNPDNNMTLKFIFNPNKDVLIWKGALSINLAIFNFYNHFNQIETKTRRKVYQTKAPQTKAPKMRSNKRPDQRLQGNADSFPSRTSSSSL